MSRPRKRFGVTVRVMGLIKHLRSRSNLKNKEGDTFSSPPNRNERFLSPDCSPSSPRRNFISRCPPKVLQRIIEFVCPHTLDKSYDTCEDAPIDEDICPLCDLRDLAHCAMTCRDWYRIASAVMYTSIRIDAVHYCPLEEIFITKRNRKSRHGKVEDVPHTRLRLLADALRGNDWLSSKVLYLKIPYMTRETGRTELTRCVSACPNLRYADLPDGFYSGDLYSQTLRQELSVRCPDIRKMKYTEGAEKFFSSLSRRHWLHIEVLELQGLTIEPTSFRSVIGNLPSLKEMKVTKMPTFTDAIFQRSQLVRDFPPLQKLLLENCMGVTAAGLVDYLERRDTQQALQVLSLNKTGVSIPELPSVLWAAARLKNLTVIATVSQSLPLDPLPPLQSISLEILHFDISPTDEYLNSSLVKPSDSFYNYLLSSLLSNSLPALRELYVRDPGLPEALLLAPPQPSFAGSGGRHRQPRGFTQPLDIYTKGVDDTEWSFNTVRPELNEFEFGFGNRPKTSDGSPHAGGRPISTYATSAGGKGWSGEAHRSVVVGNGAGGFLAAPQETYERPTTSYSTGDNKSGWGVRPMSFYPSGPIARPGTDHAIANAMKNEPDSHRQSIFGGKAHKASSSAGKHDLWR